MMPTPPMASSQVGTGAVLETEVSCQICTEERAHTGTEFNALL